MAIPESRRRTAGVALRILFDSVENGSLGQCGATRSGLVFEVGVSACEASELALDSPNGSYAFAQFAVDVAGCCRCSNAAMSFLGDGSSKLFLRN
ncbi:hypothetical protein RB195_023353 [Necator americanus]|uniref:Uncharacterized protein n=1 Tax=Necator americanus TaxID=51031 RepID=A0ABR1EJ13_NECAM